MTKTPEQIHAEVGLEISQDLHARGQQRAFGYRAFTVSDIAKIIDDANCEKISQLERDLNEARKYELAYHTFVKAYGSSPSDFASSALIERPRMRKGD